MALFAQDEWRITKRLTLSYGLRWEGNGAPYEPNGTASGFDPTVPNPRLGGRAGCSGIRGHRRRTLGFEISFRRLVQGVRASPGRCV